ncbi:hypothetical protein [Fimbriiglobus ruber]|uniref:Carboxypeptidase regulatory-like domain-containing protein n=1 Tax=Fimbriiglobus ruber TaxID=1908690 RepID=A0A225DX16_9BACT|nr:hypothetical protein [Fimbriiglobus ruber]OWK41739.1 hypothetical protein FRUB_03817 [Fimbriiglobus ruber]
MRFCLLAAAVFAAALSGCGDVPRSRVHGTVKFQGKPLTGATVIFIASDNKTYLTELKEDGSFAAAGVARGPVKVSIQQALPHVPRGRRSRLAWRKSRLSTKRPPGSPLRPRSSRTPAYGCRKFTRTRKNPGSRSI